MVPLPSLPMPPIRNTQYAIHPIAPAVSTQVWTPYGPASVTSRYLLVAEIRAFEAVSSEQQLPRPTAHRLLTLNTCNEYVSSVICYVLRSLLNCSTIWYYWSVITPYAQS